MPEATTARLARKRRSRARAAPKEPLEVTVARIESLALSHNKLCDDRWARIERMHYAIVGILGSALVGGIFLVIQHFWK